MGRVSPPEWGRSATVPEGGERQSGNPRPPVFGFGAAKRRSRNVRRSASRNQGTRGRGRARTAGSHHPGPSAPVAGAWRAVSVVGAVPPDDGLRLPTGLGLPDHPERLVGVHRDVDAVAGRDRVGAGVAVRLPFGFTRVRDEEQLVPIDGLAGLVGDGQRAVVTAVGRVDAAHPVVGRLGVVLEPERRLRRGLPEPVCKAHCDRPDDRREDDRDADHEDDADDRRDGAVVAGERG